MSDDLIKRSDAVRVINAYDDTAYALQDVQRITDGIVKVIKSLSSARPQGHYIKGENGEWYCSNCKRIDDKYSIARFCWYCGADMRGE